MQRKQGEITKHCHYRPPVSPCAFEPSHTSLLAAHAQSGAPYRPGRSPSEGPSTHAQGQWAGEQAPPAHPLLSLDEHTGSACAEMLHGLHHVMDSPRFPGDGWQSRRLQTDPCGPDATAPTPRGHSTPTCLPCEAKYEDTSRRKTSASSGRGIRTQAPGEQRGLVLGGALGQWPGGLLGTGPTNAQLGGGGSRRP